MFDGTSNEPESAVTLGDGRRLSYLEVGEPLGRPLLHFHGSGSSRLEALILAEPAKRLGVRLLAVDRPGVGSSDPRPGYCLLDWPDLAAELADRLNIDRFAVQGVSAGGPYALACAYKIPDRLTACRLISTTAPPSMVRRVGPAWTIAIWWLGANHPRLVHAYLQLAVSDRRLTVEAAEKRLRRLSHWCSKSDQVLLAGSKVRSVLARSMAEGLRQGGASSRDEAERLVAPWGFEPSDVTFAQMSLWHGGEDRLMPIAPARLLAEALPHCEAVYYPSEGHFSVLASKATEILSSLAIG